MRGQQVWRRRQNAVLIVSLHPVVKYTSAATNNRAAVAEHIPRNVQARRNLQWRIIGIYAFRQCSCCFGKNSVWLGRIVIEKCSGSTLVSRCAKRHAQASLLGIVSEVR